MNRAIQSGSFTAGAPRTNTGSGPSWRLVDGSNAFALIGTEQCEGGAVDLGGRAIVALETGRCVPRNWEPWIRGRPFVVARVQATCLLSAREEQSLWDLGKLPPSEKSAEGAQVLCLIDEDMVPVAPSRSHPRAISRVLRSAVPGSARAASPR